MSKFHDKIEEIKTLVTTKGFSKNDFNELMVAYLNDIDYEGDVYKTKGDSVYITKTKPVEEFRKLITSVLVDVGIEQNEAEQIMREYQFKKADVMLNFMNEFIYNYMKTGRRYDLGSKEDFSGKIYLKERGKVNKKNNKGQTVEQDSYFSLGQESPCPKWKKRTIDDQGKILKELSRVLVD